MITTVLQNWEMSLTRFPSGGKLLTGGAVTRKERAVLATYKKYEIKSHKTGRNRES